MRALILFGGAIALGCAVVFAGCSQTGSVNKSSGPATATSSETEHVAEGPGGDAAAGLAKLSADDRALAEKQRVCPVSGEVLGKMGAPIKLDVKGQPVFICCEGCKDELMSKSDEYLAKLKKSDDSTAEK